MFTLAVSSAAYAETLGRFHVLVVHFPISLLVLAGVIEAWRGLRGRRDVSPTATVCLAIGALGALVSSVLGLIDARFVAVHGEAATHQWLGLATAAVACVAVLALKFTRQGQANVVYRYATVACALLVSVTGHFGGNLTHGDGYLTELVFNAPHKTNALAMAPIIPAVAINAPSTPAAAPAHKDSNPAPAAPANAPAATPGAGEFAKVIHPLLAQECYDCHAGDRAKGGLKLDSRDALLKGGKSGPSVIPGDADKSPLLRRVMGLDGKKRMPPDGELTEQEIAALKKWISDGARYDGLTPTAPADGKKPFKPTLAPRKVEVPASVQPSSFILHPSDNPIDRVLSTYYTANKVSDTGVVDDRSYARRVFLDTVGMVPTPAEMTAFASDTAQDKRAQLVKKLLSDNKRYAENWLSFWNDCLRNDYQGVGYIDGGRKQITSWLFNALEKNTPYDQFVRGLVNPTKDSEGFIKGIVWRGTVSASQRPELQAAQNISQVFLGINMKCASCHDSFISDWKLSDAYGLASVFSDKPLELYRCEVATGKTASVQFLYPELGSIDATAPRAKKLARLAELLTSDQNGRFARTIVNRLWARFMGRGIVEPVDEMDNEPWNADLLDFLAADLVAHKYDLKHTISLILTSDAYQRPAAGMLDPNVKSFTFAGPVVRRMSAEQFEDSVAQLTDIWPTSPATPVAGGSFPSTFIWTNGLANRGTAPGTFYFRKTFELPAVPTKAVVAVTCDNEWRLLINGHEVSKGKDWAKPDVVDVAPHLVKGKNVIAVEATNWEVADKSAVNPAALWVLLGARVPSTDADADNGTKLVEVATDKSWQWSGKPDAGWEKADFDATKWAKSFNVGAAANAYNLLTNLAATRKTYRLREDHYRAVWTRADALAIALGRPNREIAVTNRTTAATTLQALEMTNGETLANQLRYGAEKWAAKNTPSTPELVDRIYMLALARKPTDREKQLATDLVGSPAKADGIEDLLWSLVMLPEFQLVY